MYAWMNAHAHSGIYDMHHSADSLYEARNRVRGGRLGVGFTSVLVSHSQSLCGITQAQYYFM